MASTYTVAVGSFEGPFDLLLQLIARHKLDIYDIPLAQITDDYMTVLREMQVLDLEVTTEFLLLAATLLELKAAALLHSLVRNHALVDGNKRLAWLATVVFLDLNGRRVELDDDEAFELVMSAAAGELDVEAIAERLVTTE
jgi:death-on-curing family protein